MKSHSILLISSNRKNVESKISSILESEKIENSENPDILRLIAEGKSIGIDQIRSAITFLSKKPLNAPIKVLIIEEAWKLTLDAQNALLKTLEEPTPTSLIILCVRAEEDVLETIRSRCQKLNLSSDFHINEEYEKLANQFLLSEVGERLALIDTNKKIFSDREETVKFLESLSNQAVKTKQKLGNLILQTLKEVKTSNVNCRLAIEYIALLL